MTYWNYDILRNKSSDFKSIYMSLLKFALRHMYLISNTLVRARKENQFTLRQLVKLGKVFGRVNFTAKNALHCLLQNLTDRFLIPSPSSLFLFLSISSLSLQMETIRPSPDVTTLRNSTTSCLYAWSCFYVWQRKHAAMKLL